MAKGVETIARYQIISEAKKTYWKNDKQSSDKIKINCKIINK